MLIPKRLACLQHVRDALLRGFRPAQTDEGFALEVEQILLAHPRRARQVAAAHHRGDLQPDQRVVVRDVAAALHHVDSELELGQGGLAERENVLPRLRRDITFGGQSQDGPLRLFDHAFVIHHDAILSPHQSPVLRLDGARGDLAHSRQFEVVFKNLELIGAGRRLDHFGSAHGHLLRPASAGDQSDADFDQADVGFGGADGAVAVQNHFAAAAERQVVRRDDHRLRRIAQAHGRVLKLLNGHRQLVPLALLRRKQDHHNVRAGRKILALVADDQPGEILLDLFDRKLDHPDLVLPERVHLRMELYAGDAVAKIDQARAHILLDDFALVFERFEDGHARRLGDWFVFAAGEIEVMAHAVLGLVKALGPGGEHLLDVGRDSAAFFAHPADRLFDADHVPGLKYAEFMREAPFHRVVDLDDVVGDFGDAVGGVDHRLGGSAPEEFARAVFGVNQRLQPVFEPVHIFGRFERGDFGLLALAVFERREVERLNLVAHFAEKTALGLVAEHFVVNHLLQYVGKREGLAFFVIRQTGVKVLRHVNGGVQADDVERPERRALGMADDGPGHRVDLFGRVTAFEHDSDGVEHGEIADAVSDETGRILRMNDALAQRPVAEIGDEVCDFGVGFGRGDDF